MGPIDTDHFLLELVQSHLAVKMAPLVPHISSLSLAGALIYVGHWHCLAAGEGDTLRPIWLPGAVLILARGVDSERETERERGRVKRKKREREMGRERERESEKERDIERESV